MASRDQVMQLLRERSIVVIVVVVLTTVAPFPSLGGTPVVGTASADDQTGTTAGHASDHPAGPDGVTVHGENQTRTTDGPALTNDGVRTGTPASTGFSSCTVIDSPGVYELQNDLVTSGDCITILSGNVTLDGNGHSITGNRTGTGIQIGNGTGVSVGDPVAIRNLTVTGFTTGVGVDPGEEVDLWNVETSDNAFAGMELAASLEAGEVPPTVTVRNSTVAGNDRDGIFLRASLEVYDTEIVSNADFGIRVNGVGDGSITVRRSNVSGNGGGINAGQEFLEVTDSRIVDNVGDGISGPSRRNPNVTLARNEFVANEVGVQLTPVRGVIQDNTFEANGIGMLLGGRNSPTDNTLVGNVIRNSTDAGLRLEVSAGATMNNTIYDNEFVNDVNVVFADHAVGFPNAWNVSARPGPNIVGGPSIGGNFYGTPAGDGFSQTCTDADGDGFCDSPHVLAGNNTDFLPLTTPGGASGPVDVTACRVIDSPGEYHLQNDILDSTATICINITSSDVVFDGNGHTVDGVDDDETVGIRAGTPRGAGLAPLSNVTVRNVVVSDWGIADAQPGDGDGVGISYWNVNVGLVENVVADSNLFGISLTGTGDFDRDTEYTPGETILLRNASVTDSVLSGVTLNQGTSTLTDVSVRAGPGTNGIESVSRHNAYTNVSVEGVGGLGDLGYLFVFLYANNTLTNVSAVDMASPFYVTNGGGNSTLTDVSSVGGGSHQAFRIASGNATFTNVSAVNSEGQGFRFFVFGNITLTNVSAENSGEEGFLLFPISGSEASVHTFTDIRATNNSDGVSLLTDTGSVEVTGGVFEGNAGSGVQLDGSSGATIRDSRFRDNGQWALFAANGSAFEGADVGVGSATLSFTARDVALGGVDSPPADPTSPDRDNIGQYLNVTDNSANGYLNLTVHYTDADASGVDESSLALWRNDSTAWFEVSGSSVDVDANGVSANVTAFSVFAPLGEPAATTCVEGAVAGSDGRVSLTEIQRAINWWAEDVEVPNTDGGTISLTGIQDLINAWAADATVACDT